MSFMQSVDTYIAESLKSWNVYTTALALLLSALLIYPVFFPSEPDTHPLLLARQSIAAPIRRKGESALYRASEVPHGYPLRTGLNVKDASAPRWAGGKDGDLRDVWREVARAGGVGADGREIPRGLIMRVLGKEAAEHEIEDLSKEINTIGKHLQQAGIKKLAIFLPNDIEYLLAIFACSFYNVSPILLPSTLAHSKLFDLLNKTAADGLLASAGGLSLTDLSQNCPQLRLLIWNVEKTSRQMDWSGSDTDSKLNINTWHGLVEEQASTATKALPENGELITPPDLYTVWDASEVVAFTHANLVAGMSGFISSLPLRQRFSSADLVVTADSFSNTYALLATFAALFSHASIAINSVAGPGVDLNTASSAVRPTVIVASAETLHKLHAKENAGMSSGMQRLGMATQSQAMAAGRMPTDTLLFRLLAPSASRNTPGQLRLLLTSERLGAGSPALSSTILSDLRIFTKARIVYALTSAYVAGAIAQTNIFDYRRENGIGHAPFGGPLGSVEVKVVSKTEADVKGSAQGVSGDLVVAGPAVSGGSYDTKVRCTIRPDGTIAYA